MKTRTSPLRLFCLLALLVLPLLSSGLGAAVLKECSESALRTAVRSGGVILFDCDGVIPLTSPLVVDREVILDGAGRQVVLSGNQVTRLFVVRTNGSLVLSNLSLVHGRAAAGGGVYNEGRLRAVKCVFRLCWAIGMDSQATNAAPVPGTTGEGGAIWNSGVVELVDSYLERNVATGGKGPLMERGNGVQWLASAGGFAGTGGGIHNLGELSITGSYFTNNAVSGGVGNDAIPALNLAQGNGGEGFGGAVYSRGKVSVRNSAFFGNNAYFGGVMNAGSVLRGMGGAFCSLGTLQLTNTTILEGEAIGNPGGGGAVSVLGGIADIAFATLIRNHAGMNPSGGAGRRAAIYSETNATTRVTHTVVAYAKAFVVKSPLVYGAVTDLGYNLSSDEGGVFTGPGSLNGLDPRLTEPKFFGGTLPLLLPLEGSPVVDAGLESGLVEDDQRGFSRPHGPRYDLGAAEGPLVSAVADPVISLPLVVGQQTEVGLVVSNGNRFPLSGLQIFYYPPNTMKFVETRSVEGDCPATTHLFDWQAAMGGLDLVPGQSCRFRVPLIPSRSGEWSGDLIDFGSSELREYRLIPRTIRVVGAPVVVTRSVIGAQAAEVTMRGTVQPGGLASLAWFEWGVASNALTEATLPQAVPAGFGEVSWSETRKGLAPNTRFYYRAVGSNELGVVRGEYRVGYTLGDTVFACEEGNLAPLVAAGGTIRFDCDGVITLSAPLKIRKDTTLLAEGHVVVISGSNAVRILEVAAGAKLKLDGLVFTGGLGTNGGAVMNGGELEAESCVWSNNHARAIDYALAAGGGALWNVGSARLERCIFQDNTSVGSRGVTGVFELLPGTGRGGAIANEGALQIVDSLFRRNKAVGGVGAQILSGAGPGGQGHGGGVFNAGTLEVRGTTFHENQAEGGQGGGIRIFNRPGGDAYGGAIYSSHRLTITNSTLVENGSVGGLPGQPNGVAGRAYGGALAVVGEGATVAFATLAKNEALNGGSAIHVSTAGVARVEIDHTLLAARGSNATLAGSVVDRGYNLSSDVSGLLVHEKSREGIELRLGLLGDYGGPTPTIPLLPMSPAWDGGGKGVGLGVDQRGLPRPAFGALDIGAFELQQNVLGIRSITRDEGNGYRLTGFGPPGVGYEVEGKSGESAWVVLGTGVLTDSGLFEITVHGNALNGFLRVRTL